MHAVILISTWKKYPCPRLKRSLTNASLMLRMYENRLREKSFTLKLECQISAGCCKKVIGSRSKAGTGPRLWEVSSVY